MQDFGEITTLVCEGCYEVENWTDLLKHLKERWDDRSSTSRAVSLFFLVLLLPEKKQKNLIASHNYSQSP